MQVLLNRQLHPVPTLECSGHFDTLTDRTVRRFQALRGLEDDGVVGPLTWRELQRMPDSRTVAEDESVPSVPDAPWLAIAVGEIGQRGVPGTVHNPRIIEYHATTGLRASRDETAWCASFVNWCFHRVSVRGTNSAGAASWLRWGERSVARAGAVAVIFNPLMRNTQLSRTGNHVGFLVRETESHYVILGGNQDNSVRVKSYARAQWQLKGYRWVPTS